MKTSKEIALEIAHTAHEGQYDRDGSLHFEHVMRVANRAMNHDEYVVGLLHDVLEDSGMSKEDLLEEGIADYLVEAVELLTKPDSLTYNQYLTRLINSRNILAIIVKKYDLYDNLNRSLKPGCEYQREKYTKALKRLRDETDCF